MVAALAWVMANPDWEKQEKREAKPGPKKKEIETNLSILLREVAILAQGYVQWKALLSTCECLSPNDGRLH
jgi:hypothetical protein